MAQLVGGLKLLMSDNALQGKPLQVRAEAWSAKDEGQVEQESLLIESAKAQWLVAIVMAWLGVSLVSAAVLADNLWEHTFNPSFWKIGLVFVMWLGVLLALWLIGRAFDQTAGMARWVRAFRSRAVPGQVSGSLGQLNEAIEYARQYDDVRSYKNEVVRKRRLREEDLRIMVELGRMHQADKSQLVLANV